MAIAKTNAVAVQSYNNSNYSSAYDAGSGSGRVLIVMLKTLYSVNSITYNGVGLTYAQAGGGMSMYYMVNPPSGSNTLAISFSNSSQSTAIYYYVLTGCHTSSPIGQKSTLISQSVNAGQALTMSLANCKKGSFVVNCGNDYYNGYDRSPTWDAGCSDAGSLNGNSSNFLLYSHKILSANGTASIAYTVANDGTHTSSMLCLEILAPPTAPTVTTQAGTDVSISSLTGNGNITDTGGDNPTRRGFCLKIGTTGDPTTSDLVFYDDGNYSAGAFTKAIAGLAVNTSYRLRAYATNSVGTSYGDTVQIKTLANCAMAFFLT